MQAKVIDAQHAFADAQEAAWIKAAKNGDRTAYKHLYDSYVGRVYAICLRLTADKALAEDATQEVFIQLWQKLHNFHENSRFSTWLHSVASNVTISYIRKQRGWWQRMFNLDDKHHETDYFQQTDSGSPDNVDLEAYVARLPQQARLVFVLHAIEGYRHEQVADMLNMAVGSSKAQFHRAKQLLTEWMTDAKQ